MATIENTKPIGGAIGPIVNAGAPSAGTDEVWTLTIDADGGTFKLKHDAWETAAISWSATNATLVANIDAALEALPSIGAGNVTTAVGTMTSGVGTITITAAGNLGKSAEFGTLAVADDSLTGAGAGVSVARTTPGVTATARGVGKGALLTDTTNGKVYINTGTAIAPTWTVVGTQT